MTKLITYSLFKGGKEPFEERSYIRGFYWNARMNNFIYPDWRTHLEIDRATYTEYKNLFDWLVGNNNLSLNINEATPELCKGMLWRMKPIFTIDISHVICRDTDSITTYKEAQCVQAWLESGIGFHAINDNPAHGGLMGGMVGFDTAKLKGFMRWNSWGEMIGGYDLSKHGSDQNLMNQKLHSKIYNDLFLHKLNGSGCAAKRTETTAEIRLPLVDKKLWESNLVCRHIGSAGVVEMETLRFFKRFDEYNWKFQPIEKEFPKIFYWHL